MKLYFEIWIGRLATISLNKTGAGVETRTGVRAQFSRLRDERLEMRGEPTCTGGKSAFTQQAHGEFIVSSETKCPPNTQQAHGEYF